MRHVPPDVRRRGSSSAGPAWVGEGVPGGRRGDRRAAAPAGDRRGARGRSRRGGAADRPRRPRADLVAATRAATASAAWLAGRRRIGGTANGSRRTLHAPSARIRERYQTARSPAPAGNRLTALNMSSSEGWHRKNQIARHRVTTARLTLSRSGREAAGEEAGEEALGVARSGGRGRGRARRRAGRRSRRSAG